MIVCRVPLLSPPAGHSVCVASICICGTPFWLAIVMPGSCAALGKGSSRKTARASFFIPLLHLSAAPRPVKVAYSLHCVAHGKAAILAPEESMSGLERTEG